VRADPVGRWWDLPRATRAGLALRVVLVGAESTGKTTLAAGLAGALRARGGAWGATRWVPEYGRAYWMTRVAVERAANPLTGFDLDWRSAEFTHIAARQTREEEAAAREGGPVLVCDTDAFATALWHERYTGRVSPDVSPRVDTLPGRRLYLLADVADAPFVQDGWRDGERIREAMNARFVAALDAAGATWRPVGGPWPARLPAALRHVDEALVDAFRFTPPPG
jgi:nicotinamide riboside kinase